MPQDKTNLMYGLIAAASLLLGLGTSEVLAQATDVDCTGCVDGDEIATGAVKGRHILNGSILSKHIRNGNLTGEKIRDGAIDESKIAGGAVSGEKIAAGAVGVTQIDPSQVQMRVGGSCQAGSYITSVAENGSVTCEPVIPSVVSTSYTLPGSGGTHGGSYLHLETGSGRALAIMTCSYGFEGDTSVFWFAWDQAVVAGDIEITSIVDGYAMTSFTGLQYNAGQQNRAFAETQNQGPRPWHGVFTVNDGGDLTRWEVIFTGPSSGNGDCTAVVNASGSVGRVEIRHP